MKKLPQLHCAHCGKFIEECQGFVDPCDPEGSTTICHRHAKTCREPAVAARAEQPVAREDGR